MGPEVRGRIEELGMYPATRDVGNRPKQETVWSLRAKIYELQSLKLDQVRSRLLYPPPFALRSAEAVIACQVSGPLGVGFFNYGFN